MRHPLDADTVRQLLDYDPATGDFIWRTRAGETRSIKIWNAKFAGKVSGRTSVYGYREIAIGSKLYRAHRLAWLYMTGEWPAQQVDHIDGDKANNRFSNLREATPAENARNGPIRRRNSCGLKGVSYNRKSRAYVAMICADRRLHYLGRFKTAEEAHLAYCEAAKRLHGQFARAA